MDLQPTDHLWDHLIKQIPSRICPPANHNELIGADIKEWDNIPQDIINNLITSMLRRMNTVIICRNYCPLTHFQTQKTSV